MTKFLIVLALLISTHIQGQSVRSIEHKFYSNYKRILELKNCNMWEFRMNRHHRICFLAYDTVTRERFIIGVRRMENQTFYIEDVCEFKLNEKKYDDCFFLIGSYNTRKGEKNDTFLIALEQDDKNDHALTYSKSLAIYRAWTYNHKSKRIRKVRTKGLQRVNEGYYRNKSFA